MSVWLFDFVSKHASCLTGRRRRWHIIAVVGAWLLYLLWGNEHGPPLVRSVSQSISTRLTVWQAVVLASLVTYVCRNCDKLANLGDPPDALAKLYAPAWSRAIWIQSALKAGHWTAMPLRRKWIRDIAGLIFTGYYLFAWEQGEEKVRRINASSLTIRHMRVAWEVGRSPYIGFLIRQIRPKKYRHASPPRMIRIPRNRLDNSLHSEGSVETWLYFDGSDDELAMCDTLILDIPGGGFVSMCPRENDDRLMAWNKTTGLPLLSINYNKAPEFPYPFALHECFDAYRELMAKGGRVLGMNLEEKEKEQRKLKIIICGDSSGGNLATAVTLMILERQGQRQIYHPDNDNVTFRFSIEPPIAVILAYPALDLNGVTWVSEADMQLIHERTGRKVNNPVFERRSETYNQLARPNGAQRPSSDHSHDYSHSSEISGSNGDQKEQGISSDKAAEGRRHGLALSSLISYFGDRVLSAQLLRACTIMYIGKQAMPDLTNDYLLSPIRAPESLLAKFPKVYLLTGERDPLLDSTVLFAGKLRRAKEAAHSQEDHVHSGKSLTDQIFNVKRHVEVKLIPGVSHGFLQMVPVYPDGWALIEKMGDWMTREAKEAGARGLRHHHHHHHHHHNIATRTPGYHLEGDDIEVEESGLENDSIARLGLRSSSTIPETTLKKPVSGEIDTSPPSVAVRPENPVCDRRYSDPGPNERISSDSGSSAKTEDTSPSDTDATLKGVSSDADLLEARMESLRGSLMQ